MPSYFLSFYWKANEGSQQSQEESCLHWCGNDYSDTIGGCICDFILLKVLSLIYLKSQISVRNIFIQKKLGSKPPSFLIISKVTYKDYICQ